MMSETTPDYLTKRDQSRPWLCCNCGYEIAMIVNGEAWVSAQTILSDAAPLVLCPACGAGNMWPPEACARSASIS